VSTDLAPSPTAASAATAAPFVEVRDLRRVFDVSKPWLNRVLEGGEKQYLKAVDGVSFDIDKGRDLRPRWAFGSASPRWPAWWWPPAAHRREV
jgi:ABC-type microcin C transport system duplicated ATPase subunit YejF